MNDNDILIITATRDEVTDMIVLMKKYARDDPSPTGKRCLNIIETWKRGARVMKLKPRQPVETTTAELREHFSKTA